MNKNIIQERVETFQRNKETFKKTYNEEMLRIEFVNPFFEALGWDISNKAGNAEAYKDVIHEDAIKIGSATKAPDYAFRIGGVKRFFVEAKKPAVNIKDDIHPAFQLRRYAWSAKLPLSILTDFEEFAVYDCRIRPFKTDKASVGRVMFYTFEDYIEKWDEIAEIFSKDAIYKGSFDKYVESSKKKRGTAEVDDAFLKEIETWRDILARNIALRNTDLTQRELNFAVARTIDRIVFLRIAEDRGMEDYGQLQALKNSENVYEGLVGLYRRADDKYNSGLFHFRQEKDRAGSADELTTKLTIDDKVIKDIVKNLYYPDSSYEFSVLPADILGHIYEQFLGKVISLTAGHHAKIEEKPEVRKAGGVYYTPTYIVDYIVKNTVGELVKGKTPQQVAKLRILDPACGSGSFLIGAYQYLLDWHRDWYSTNEPEKHSTSKNPAVFKAGINDWRLTTAKRKEILLNNIYGVDIDPQAVEVSKLSLLLKVLEGESQETLNQQRKLFHERALPDLGNNIKCGNSLIGPDFYDNQQINLLDDEERYRINVFDWEAEFPQIFTKGGFDAVIGNPPYGMRLIYSENEKDYFKNYYNSSKGSFENYFLFYEASLRTLNRAGKHGFIVPVTWLTIPSAESLRKHILDEFFIEKIIWLPELVFKNAQVNTLVSIINKTKKKTTDIYIFNTTDINSDNYSYKKITQKDFIKNNYKIDIFINEEEKEIFDKIEKITIPLSEISKPCSGYNPYEVGKGIAPNGKQHSKETVKTKPYHSSYKIDEEWKPEIIGRNLKRYSLQISGNRWIKYGRWLAAPRDSDNFQGNRLLVQEITGGTDRRIIAVFYDKELYYSRDVIPIKCNNKQYQPYYLLGVLNSHLITWFHHKRNPKAQKGLFPKILVSDLKRIPIRKIDFSNKKEKTQHDKMVNLVNRMLELNKQLPKAKTDHDRTTLQRQIDATDKQIDKLVYELYDLTEEEIKIVEGG